MWFRIILAAITIICTFSRVVHATNQTSNKKDIICVLLMAGLKKEDLDENARQTLKQHNVDIENENLDEMRKICEAENHLNNTTEVTMAIINSTETTVYIKTPDATTTRNKIGKPSLIYLETNNTIDNTTVTTFWDPAELNLVKTSTQATTIEQETITEVFMENIEKENVEDANVDFNNVLNMQYMKDVRDTFGRDNFTETTTEKTTVVTKRIDVINRSSKPSKLEQFAKNIFPRKQKVKRNDKEEPTQFTKVTTEKSSTKTDMKMLNMQYMKDAWALISKTYFLQCTTKITTRPSTPATITTKELEPYVKNIPPTIAKEPTTAKTNDRIDYNMLNMQYINDAWAIFSKQYFDQSTRKITTISNTPNTLTKRELDQYIKNDSPNKQMVKNVKKAKPTTKIISIVPTTEKSSANMLNMQYINDAWAIFSKQYFAESTTKITTMSDTSTTMTNIKLEQTKQSEAMTENRSERSDDNMLNMQYIKNVWDIFSKQYFAESTTKVTTIPSTSITFANDVLEQFVKNLLPNKPIVTLNKNKVQTENVKELLQTTTEINSAKKYSEMGYINDVWKMFFKQYYTDYTTIKTTVTARSESAPLRNMELIQFFNNILPKKLIEAQGGKEKAEFTEVLELTTEKRSYFSVIKSNKIEKKSEELGNFLQNVPADSQRMVAYSKIEEATTAFIKEVESTTKNSADLNMLNINDAWGILSKLHLAESTTVTSKTEPTMTFTNKELELFLKNLLTKAKPDKKEVTAKLSKELESIDTDELNVKPIAITENPDVKAKEVLIMISKLLTNNKEKVAKIETLLEEDNNYIKQKCKGFYCIPEIGNNNNLPVLITAVPLWNTPATPVVYPMMLASNVIQDIANKVKSILIKDLSTSTAESAGTSSTSTTTTTTTAVPTVEIYPDYTTKMELSKDGDNLLDEFKQLFKDFKEEIAIGNDKISPKTSTVIYQPDLKPKLLPNIIQTNQMEIPPYFSIDTNPQSIRNIIVHVPNSVSSSRPTTKKVYKTQKQKNPENVTQSVNITPQIITEKSVQSIIKDIKIDDTFPKITEISHKVYGYHPHPKADKDLNTRPIGKLDKLNKMFHTINKIQLDSIKQEDKPKKEQILTNEQNYRRQGLNLQDKFPNQAIMDYPELINPSLKYRKDPQITECYPISRNEESITDSQKQHHKNEQRNKLISLEQILLPDKKYNIRHPKVHHSDRENHYIDMVNNVDPYAPIKKDKSVKHRYVKAQSPERYSNKETLYNKEYNKPQKILHKVYTEPVNSHSNNHRASHREFKKEHKKAHKANKKIMAEPIIKRQLHNMRYVGKSSQYGEKDNYISKNYDSKVTIENSREGIHQLIVTLDKAIDAYKNENDPDSHIRGLKNSNNYDDASFREFLKTQQKVTDILDKIINLQPGTLRSVEIIS